MIKCWLLIVIIFQNFCFIKFSKLQQNFYKNKANYFILHKLYRLLSDKKILFFSVYKYFFGNKIQK